MAVLTQTYDPAEGPILHVKIAPTGENGGQLFPLLLDTGADGSSISREVIDALSLLPIGRRDTFASGGKQKAMRTFLVDMSIMFDDMEFPFNEIEVAEFSYMKPSIRGLIGRDILCRGDFSMNRDHTFALEI